MYFVALTISVTGITRYVRIPAGEKQQHHPTRKDAERHAEINDSQTRGDVSQTPKLCPGGFMTVSKPTAAECLGHKYEWSR